MKSGMIFKLLGIVSLVVGVALVVNPELVSSRPIPEDTFDAIERRIWWGLFIGLGVLLIFHRQLVPWLATFAAVVAASTFGVLAARLIGMSIDGSVSKQWFWVAVEAVIILVLVIWYGKIRT